MNEPFMENEEPPSKANNDNIKRDLATIKHLRGTESSFLERLYLFGRLHSPNHLGRYYLLETHR